MEHNWKIYDLKRVISDGMVIHNKQLMLVNQIKITHQLDI